MDKPLILVEQDMKQEVIDIVNKYSPQVPMSMIITALNETLTLCVQIQERQIEQAREEYEKSIKESEVSKDAGCNKDN